MDGHDHLVSLYLISFPWVDLTKHSYCITIAAAVVLYFVLRRENRIRESLELDEVQRDKIAFDDLTDKQNSFFRYAL